MPVSKLAIRAVASSDVARRGVTFEIGARRAIRRVDRRWHRGHPGMRRVAPAKRFSLFISISVVSSSSSRASPR